MPQNISPSDPRLSWPGAASVEHQPDWSMPWRIDHTQRSLFAQPLVERAARPAGVRIAFRTDSTWVAGSYSTFLEATAIDLCCDGKFVASLSLNGTNTFTSMAWNRVRNLLSCGSHISVKFGCIN